MPAPQPIQFAHEIGPLGQLAMAAGAAKARRQDFQQQRAHDSAFIRDELNRRQRQHEVEANFRLQQAAQAGGQSTGAQAFALQRAAAMERAQARNQQARAMRATMPSSGSALSRALAAATSGKERIALIKAMSSASTGQERKNQNALFSALAAYGDDDKARVPFAPPPGGEGSATLESEGGTLSTVPGMEGFTGTGDFTHVRPEGLPPSPRTPPAVRGGFAQGTPQAAETFTTEQAEQVRLLEQDRGIAPQDREFLKQAIRSGITTPSLLAEMNRRRPGRDTGEPKIDGLTLTDWTNEKNRLKRKLSGLINDPENDYQDPRYESLAAEVEAIGKIQEKLRAAKGTPQLSGNTLPVGDNPQPDTGGLKQLKKSDAAHYFDKAGGDIDAAMQMAKDDGFIVQ